MVQGRRGLICHEQACGKQQPGTEMTAARNRITSLPVEKKVCAAVSGLLDSSPSTTVYHIVNVGVSGWRRWSATLP